MLDGQVRFGVDVQNPFNQTLLTGYNAVLVSPVFGKPNSGLNGHRVDLSLSYSFGSSHKCMHDSEMISPIHASA